MVLKEISDEEINKNKVFNPSLSLYEIDLGEQDNISKNLLERKRERHQCSHCVSSY
jgi:hypothetical protein